MFGGFEKSRTFASLLKRKCTGGLHPEGRGFESLSAHHKNRNTSANKRALSSAGSEHLVYTQRVGGSNPSAPTEMEVLRRGS